MDLKTVKTSKSKPIVQNAHSPTFINISGSSNGGELYYSKNSKHLGEYSSFKKWSISSSDDAIYFGNEDQCILLSVCEVRCTTDNNQGQLSYLSVSDGLNNNNHIIDHQTKYQKPCNMLTFPSFNLGHAINRHQNFKNELIVQKHSLIQQKALLQNPKKSVLFNSHFSIYPFQHRNNFLFIKQSYNDYFNDNYINKTENSHISVSNNMWIYGSTFKNILDSGKGSCICKDSNTHINLLVEYSSFNSCSSWGAGGKVL